MFGTLLGHKKGGFPSIWVEPPFLKLYSILSFFLKTALIEIVRFSKSLVGFKENHFKVCP